MRSACCVILHRLVLITCLAGAVQIKHNGPTEMENSVMKARIYKPARNAMQSGVAKTKGWVLDFVPAEQRKIDPLMGWTSSGDMQSQVRLRFATREAAEDYARDHNIDAVVIEPKTRKPNIRPRGYAENFATDRRGPWTH
jgi:hypothetical protein